MATKAAKPRSRDESRAAQWQDIPPLPVGMEQGLSQYQVRLALGGIAERTLRGMIASGEFPKCDFMLTNKARWLRTTVEKWLLSQKEKASGVGQSS